MPSQSADEKKNGWVVYILRCADDSLYTGVTTSLARRLREHNETGAGARYTRARRPVQLVHAECAQNRSIACRREYQLKQLSRAEKEALIASSRTALTISIKEV